MGKFIFKFICAIGVFLGLQQAIELRTRGFYLQKILETDLVAHPDWNLPEVVQPEQKSIDALLDQPFTFLGAGSECFAFLSADKTTVIKFFKLDRVRPVYVLRGLFCEDHSGMAGTISQASLLPKRILGMREFRIARTFNSLKLSYDHLKEETGLIYLHLNPTSHFQKQLTLVDPCGIAHTIDLDTTRFYLQKSAIPLEKHLLALKESKEHERAKQCIASLCTLIIDRCRKGFADRDPYNKNFGFIGDRAIEIDTGSFRLDSHINQTRLIKEELFFVTLELRKWAQSHYPELLPFITSQIATEWERLA